MNLLASIEVLQAIGGPGSGCHGSNCGRPKGSKTIVRQGRKYTQQVGKPPDKIASDVEQKLRSMPGRLALGPAKPAPKLTSEQRIAERQAQQELIRQHALGKPVVIMQEHGARQVVPGPKARSFGTAERLDPKTGEFSPEDTKVDQRVALMRSAEDMDRYRKKLADLKQQGAIASGPSATESKNMALIEPLDKVVTTAPVKVWDDKAGALRILPPGRNATVGYIHPGSFGVPALVDLKLGKNIEPTYMKLEDVQLLDKHPDNLRQNILKDVADVKPGRILSVSTNQDGAKYTIIKPSNVPDDDDMRGKMRPHSLRGNFTATTSVVKVLGDSNQRAQVFTAQPTGAKPPEWVNSPFVETKVGKGKSETFVDPHGGSLKQLGSAGCTVFVYRSYNVTKARGYSDDAQPVNKTYKSLTRIQEISTGDYGHTFSMSRTFDYKNPKGADSFLKARYGIRTSLPKSLKSTKAMGTEEGVRKEWEERKGQVNLKKPACRNCGSKSVDIVDGSRVGGLSGVSYKSCPNCGWSQAITRKAPRERF